MWKYTELHHLGLQHLLERASESHLWPCFCCWVSPYEYWPGIAFFLLEQTEPYRREAQQFSEYRLPVCWVFSATAPVKSSAWMSQVPLHRGVWGKGCGLPSRGLEMRSGTGRTLHFHSNSPPLTWDFRGSRPRCQARPIGTAGNNLKLPLGELILQNYRTKIEI